MGERLDYLLLGQEEYLEHHSEITHCRFTTSGSVVASSDVDGVLKVYYSVKSKFSISAQLIMTGLI